MRLLLLHVRGAESFAHLRTVNGVQYSSFKEAAQALQLLRDDKDLHSAMEEAALLQMPTQLRMLFASICLWSCPTDALLIFNKFQHHLIEDFLHLNFNREDAINQCLNQLEAVFTQQGKHCTHFGLPAPVMQTFGSIGHNFNVEHERVVANEYMSKLNEEQRSVVEKVLQSVDKVSKQTAFFIDGPGGTGKTFCYSAITHRLRSQGKNVISVA